MTPDIDSSTDREGARAGELIDVDALIGAYYDDEPDPGEPQQRVSFGTSGHRGSAASRSFNEWHILATTEAICRYRRAQGIDGPLFLGRDTHALSEPALRTAVEVLVAHGVDVRVDPADRFTPTPAISHAIQTHNRQRSGTGAGLADGIVVTPSHNPPQDGGFKYNPPDGGPAGSDVTAGIQDTANRLLAERDVRRIPYARAAPELHAHDFLGSYVADLDAIVDLNAIRTAGLTLGVDPLGGASVDYWAAIAERHRLDLEVVNPTVDPTFAFMPRDWDGKIRMDCSSPYAMASLVGLGHRFDVAFANDPDADRHGIVAGSAGLLDPNHYLAVMIEYLFGGNRDWQRDVGVGKTLVSSSMIDRVVAQLGRRLFEVPVGFKWFVDGLADGSLGFGGEESAGASFLRFDGSAWSTDKDGIVCCLLAAEMTARNGRDPAERFDDLAARFGRPSYRRIDAPATPAQKAALLALSPRDIDTGALAGQPITAVLTRAPGNDAPIGGLKVLTDSGWFAARPSGTEDVYKIYAESFEGEQHLTRVIREAQALVDAALARG